MLINLLVGTSWHLVGVTTVMSKFVNRRQFDERSRDPRYVTSEKVEIGTVDAVPIVK